MDNLLNYQRLGEIVLLGALLAAGAGCNAQNQSDDALKQQAAQTTEQVKKQAQQTAADAKAAAATAERKINDVAAGVKEGLNAKSAAASVDINAATEVQLTALPGVTNARARRIIRGRPYGSPHDLVSKGVLTESQYEQISGQVVAN